ncbi:MAG TPA: carbon monoxide dehydrogenase subunit G [Thermoanaerobaculia bacterium]|nr:carbon monoxide dehydrogenase subunit G [Thermoanaerobaculia bacterium]
MKIQGEHTFDAPRERVWRALLDPEVLARTLPGCERLERTAENEFRGALNVQIGPVKGQFQGTLQLSDLVPLEGYHMKLDGSGPAGFMNGQGSLRIADADTPGRTVLRYDLDAQVGGKLAGLGQRLVESSARSITKQGLEGLGRELQAMTAAEPTAPPATPAIAAAEVPLPDATLPAPSVAIPPPQAPTHPTQAEFAARVAGDVARDLVPPAKRPWMIGGGLLLLGVVALLLARACGG